MTIIVPIFPSHEEMGIQRGSVTCSGSRNLGLLASALKLFSLYQPWSQIPTQRKRLSGEPPSGMRDSCVHRRVWRFPEVPQQSLALNPILELPPYCLDRRSVLWGLESAFPELALVRAGGGEGRCWA